MKTLGRLLQNKRTAGVAQLNNNIYVLPLDRTFLAVFDAVSFERLEDVELSLKEGFDKLTKVKAFSIAACSVNQCLYVLHRDDYCIFRLEIKNGGKTVKWMGTAARVMCNNNFLSKLYMICKRMLTK